MLAGIVKSVIGSLTGDLLGRVEGVFKAYFEGKITREQLQAELSKALIASFTEVEKAHADSIAKTYASFMTAATQSPPMMRAWTIVVYSQLAVLLWHQVGIPAMTLMMGPGWKYPSSGTTVDWSYALLAGMLGLGAVALRTGPAKFDMDKLKAMIAR